VKRKTLPCLKAKLRKIKLEELLVFAEEDSLISAASIHNIRISGSFEGRDEWIVEKVVISAEDSSILTVPTTMIRSDSPYLPIANPGIRPHYIRAGEIVGYFKDPLLYLDSLNKEELPKYIASTEAIKSIVRGYLRFRI
jgi:hypothetical protein